jgi:hypothetical protein
VTQYDGPADPQPPAPADELPAEELPAEEDPAEEDPAEEDPAEEDPAEEDPSGGMKARLWVLLTLPLGFTTWAAFLYIGVRARRGRWLIWAAVYAAGLVTWLALENPKNSHSPSAHLSAALALTVWIGGALHALAISSEAAYRITARKHTSGSSST